MKDTTLVFRTDAHIADTAPQARVDDWTATILDKIAQVNDIARAEGAEAILDGGDLFHIKSPTRNSHRLVERVAAVLAQGPPTFCCVGNHDVKYGNMEFLPESPLGVLYASEAVHRLYDTHEAVFGGDGRPVVRVVGIPYHGVEYDWNRLSSLVKGDEDYLVAVAHCLASPRGGEMFGTEDILQYGELANLAPDVWCFGHWHKDQGVQQIGETRFINPGSLSRGALNEDDVKRTPKCVVMRFEKSGVVIEERKLKVAPAMEVFDIEGRARQEARDLTMETFVGNLKDVLLGQSDRSIEDIVRADDDLPDVVKERVLGYLEQSR